jgi:hypothetical protein
VARAEIIDRIAVSVGNSVITTSDIDLEIRVTAFQTGIKPDLSPVNRKATAQRLVEQKLIRRELELSKYPVPVASAVQPMLDELKMRYPSTAAFQQSLAEYGITQQDLGDELLWQLTLLRFIEVRFRPGIQVSDQAIQDYFDKVVKPAALAAHPNEPVSLEDYRDKIQDTLAGKRADEEVDAWLRQAEKSTEIVYHEDAFA